MERELVAAVELVDAEPEPAVDDRDGNDPVGLGGDIVLEHLLDETFRRSHERAVALDGVVAARLDAARRNEQLRAGVDDREADVDVVEEHVRGRVEADVLDRVVDTHARLADTSLDPPAQQELLAEHGGLEHLALRPQHALLAVPALAVAGQARRAVRHAPVQAEALGLLRREVVLRGRVLGHEERVVDPAGRQEPAAPGAEEAEALRLTEPRPREADARAPGKRATAVLAAPEIEGAVDEHVESEAGAGAELEHAHAPLGTVPERDEADARDLVEPPDPLEQLGLPVRPPPQLGHPLSFPAADDYVRAGT